MRKFLLVVVLCVAVLTLPAEVWGADTSARWEAFARSLSDLAEKIATHNKPVFETKFTQQERRDTPSEIWSRVWAKDKTLVIGAADRSKNFYAYYMETRDPDLVFAGGIRVGADIGVLEKYLGAPLRQQEENHVIKMTPGEISLFLESDFGDDVNIRHKGGKITELEWEFLDVERPFSEKTLTFVNKKKAEMGLSAGMTMSSEPDPGAPLGTITKGWVPAQIRGMRVNLRSGPSTKSKVITQLNEGDTLKVYGTSHESDGTWYKVQTSKGREGWVFGKYVR